MAKKKARRTKPKSARKTEHQIKNVNRSSETNIGNYFKIGIIVVLVALIIWAIASPGQDEITVNLIVSMRSQGLDDNQIMTNLQNEGYSSSQISEAISQADMTASDSLVVTVLTSADCDYCDTSQIVSVTQQLFPEATFKTVQTDSSEGQQLIEDYSLTVLPTYIFNDKLTETATWTDMPQIQSSFQEAGDSYRLKDSSSGSSYYIDEEARTAYEDMMNNYAQANLEALGYTSGKPRLDYFVMSFCPYGNPADEAASQVYDLLVDKVEIVPHYIVSVSGETIQSLHGEQEGNQGIRELCALREFGLADFFAFTLKTNTMCTSNNADTCWESAAEAAGVDAEAIRLCEEADKLTIAQAENDIIMSVKTLRQGNLVAPQASPTFLINGASYNGARTGDALKQALCSLFAGDAPDECGDVIAGATTAPAGNC